MKKDGALVVAFQSPLGRGTSKNKVGNVVGNNEQKVNFVGHAFETRFLIVAGLKEDYRDNPDVLQQVLDVAVSSLDDEVDEECCFNQASCYIPSPLGSKVIGPSWILGSWF